MNVSLVRLPSVAVQLPTFFVTTFSINHLPSPTHSQPIYTLSFISCCQKTQIDDRLQLLRLSVLYALPRRTMTPCLILAISGTLEQAYLLPLLDLSSTRSFGRSFYKLFAFLIQRVRP